MTLPSKVFPSLAFLLIMLYGFSVSAKELKTPEAGVVKIIGQLEKGTGFIFQLAPDGFPVQPDISTITRLLS